MNPVLLRASRAALPALALLLGGCASPEPVPFAAAEVLPWPEPSQGCEAHAAPSLPPHHDPAAVAAAMTWVYRDQPVEAYCGCRFRRDQSVPAQGCGYVDENPAAFRVNWEPIVPPVRFAVYRACWERLGKHAEADPEAALRKCAASDPEFRAMQADLYNYHPVIAGLSQRRGDNPFGVVQGEPRDFGACDFESQSVMGKSAVIEPPPAVSGDIARAYLYMAAKYGKGKDWKIKLSREQRQLLEKWSDADPVDDLERRRACRIEAIQGWPNPYVR